MKILRTIIIIIAATIVAMMVAVVLIALDAKDDAVITIYFVTALATCGLLGFFDEPSNAKSNKLKAEINNNKREKAA